jgi:hypothetical protein
MVLINIRNWLTQRFGLETLAIAVRILAFIAVIFIPVFNEAGGRVSPLIAQSSVDIDFYLKSAEKLFDRDFNLINELIRDYSAENLVKNYQADNLSPGFSPPVFPAILRISGYEEGRTLPLSLTFLIIGIFFTLIWINYLKFGNIHYIWLLVFIFIPNSIWFTLSISTDLIFAAIFAAFYLSYFQKTSRFNSPIIWILLVLAASLTRTISISLLAFIVLDQIFFSQASRKRRFWIVAVICVAGSMLMVLYIPSLGGYSNPTNRFSFFGIPAMDYAQGIYPALPSWLDHAASWLSLLGAKILYLVGLRPSFSGIPWYMLLLRSGQGFILLPGLIYLVLRGDRRELLLVGLYVLPVLLGPAQDRYVLPIQPILFYYGALAYSSIWLRLRKVVPA